MSINRGMDKEDVVHIYSGILLSHKKDEIIPVVAVLMDLEIAMLSQTEKDKYHMILFRCGVLKKGTNKVIYKTEVESQMQKTSL